MSKLEEYLVDDQRDPNGNHSNGMIQWLNGCEKVSLRTAHREAKADEAQMGLVKALSPVDGQVDT